MYTHRRPGLPHAKHLGSLLLLLDQSRRRSLGRLVVELLQLHRIPTPVSDLGGIERWISGSLHGCHEGLTLVHLSQVCIRILKHFAGSWIQLGKICVWGFVSLGVHSCLVSLEEEVVAGVSWLVVERWKCWLLILVEAYVCVASPVDWVQWLRQLYVLPFLHLGSFRRSKGHIRSTSHSSLLNLKRLTFMIFQSSNMAVSQRALEAKNISHRRRILVLLLTVWCFQTMVCDAEPHVSADGRDLISAWSAKRSFWTTHSTIG